MGIDEVHSTLRCDRPFRVISERRTIAIVGIYLLGFVVSEGSSQHELLVGEKLAANAAVDTKLRQKKSACAAAYMGVSEPVFGDIAHDSGAVVPPGIAISV